MMLMMLRERPLLSKEGMGAPPLACPGRSYRCRCRRLCEVCGWCVVLVSQKGMQGGKGGIITRMRGEELGRKTLAFNSFQTPKPTSQIAATTEVRGTFKSRCIPAAHLIPLSFPPARTKQPHREAPNQAGLTPQPRHDHQTSLSTNFKSLHQHAAVVHVLEEAARPAGPSTQSSPYHRRCHAPAAGLLPYSCTCRLRRRPKHHQNSGIPPPHNHKILRQSSSADSLVILCSRRHYHHTPGRRRRPSPR